MNSKGSLLMIRVRLIIVSCIFAFFLAACGANTGPKEKTSPIPSDIKSAELTGGGLKIAGPVPMELFVMSQCPFGKSAEAIVGKVLRELPHLIRLKIYFIVDPVEGGEKFKSLHGPEEVAIDRAQACVGIVHPDKQLNFIVTSNETGDAWDMVAKNVGLDVDAIGKCVEDGRGDAFLADNAKRAKERGANASPTLFIAGQEYKGVISSLDLFEYVCSAMKDAPEVCKRPPAILSRTDGETAGRCSAEPTPPPVDPAMVDDAVFTHTVIYAADAFSNNMDQVLGQTLRYFPKAQVRKLSSDDPEGKKLIAKYELQWLPAFIFPKEIEKAKTYEQLKPALVPLPKNDGYQINPAQLGSNYSLTRPPAKDEIRIIYTPYSIKALTILADVLDLLKEPEYQAYADKVHFLPAGRMGRGDAINAQAGPAEVEEIERSIAILGMGTDKYRKYVEIRRKSPTSSYWEEFCEVAGLSPNIVKAKARDPKTIETLKTNSKLATELTLEADIAFLVENRELAKIMDKEDFKKLLKHVFK